MRWKYLVLCLLCILSVLILHLSISRQCKHYHAKSTLSHLLHVQFLHRVPPNTYSIYLKESILVSTFSMTNQPMNVNFPFSTGLHWASIYSSFTPSSQLLIVSFSVFISANVVIFFSERPIQPRCIKPIFWQACRDYGDNETTTAEENVKTR